MTKGWLNSVEQLDELLRLLKRHGVAKYVDNGLEIQIFPEALRESYPEIEPSRFSKSVEDDYNEIKTREKLLADIQGEF